MEKIISRFLREQRRYTKAELASLFVYDEEGVEHFIRNLKSYNVLKAVRNSNEQKSMSDLLDADVEAADDSAASGTYLYVFTFVGVITYGNRILKIYPKYIRGTEAPLEELKQVLKVLEKYNRSEDVSVHMFSGVGENQNFNLLAVILFLLHDYYESGLYASPEEIIEVNGEGDILWQKTIDETFPIISRRRPYYVTMYTRKTVNDEEDFFRKLHQAVLTECSRRLQSAQLMDLFEMEPLRLTDERIEDFGEEDYILSRIFRELDVQFDTRKQILLKTMYAFITEKEKVFEAGLGISLYGTSAFNMVWEKACAQIFNNRLQMPLGDLRLVPETELEKYPASQKLIDIIEKPVWSSDGENGHQKTAADTLIPDLVTFSEDKQTFVILDAKYYNLQMEREKPLRGQPGIESITKQYLYQQAYKAFATACHIPRFFNCFLLPTEEDNVINKGFVRLDMMKALGLNDIQVRLLPAKQVYACYLGNRRMSLDILEMG